MCVHTWQVPWCPAALAPWCLCCPHTVSVDRLIVKCANVLQSDNAQELFAKIGYTGEPEMFTVWTSLLLDRPD